MKNGKDNITWIDSLKGIALCGVIMIHTGGGNLPSFLGNIGNIGKNGVQLFFVISVYLLYSSLERVFLEGNKGFSKSKIINWWLKKFLKLVPLYYLAIFSYTLIVRGNKVWLGNEGYVSLKNILAHMLFLHGFVPHYSNSILGVEWYLGVLAIIYIGAPFLYKVVNTFAKSVMAYVLVVFICFFVNTYAYSLCEDSKEVQVYSNYIGTFWIFAQLAVIMFGIIIYFILRSNVLAMVGQKRLLSYVLLVFAVTMIIGQAYDRNELFVIGKTPLFAFWYGMIIISQNLWNCRFIDNIIFREIGKYSYPIYLFHYLLVHVYNRLISLELGYDILNWGIKYVAVVSTSYLISYFVVRFFDAPLNRWLVKKLRL